MKYMETKYLMQLLFELYWLQDSLREGALLWTHVALERLKVICLIGDLS